MTKVKAQATTIEAALIAAACACACAAIAAAAAAAGLPATY